MAIWIKTVEPRWLKFVAARLDFDEVNLWNPSDQRSFIGAETGDTVVFRVKGRRNSIAGCGTFFTSSIYWAADAWSIFGERNGAESCETFIARIQDLRMAKDLRRYAIACHDIVEPVYFPGLAARVPEETLRRLGSGPIDEDSDDGKLLLSSLKGAASRAYDAPIEDALAHGGRGRGREVRPRRSGFRMLMDDAYNRTCAITGTTVVLCLESAHIIADRFRGPMIVQNACLLRRDLHPLLEAGYLSISHDYRVMISAWLPNDYPQSHDYVALNGAPLRLPKKRDDWPDQDLLERHRSAIFFRGGQIQA